MAGGRRGNGTNNGNGGANGGGRPPKFFEKVLKTIIACIMRGDSIVNACETAGISYRTYRRWKKKAAAFLKSGQARKRIVRFCREVRDASAMVRHKMVAIITEAALGNPAKDKEPSPEWAWRWLRARAHKDWGETQKVEHSGKDGGAMRLEFIEVATQVRPPEEDAPADEPAVLPEEKPAPVLPDRPAVG